MAYIDEEDFKPINRKKRRLATLPLDEYPSVKYRPLRNRGVSDQGFFDQKEFQRWDDYLLRIRRFIEENSE